MCGLGALGIYLLKYGFEKVIFNDINPEMIDAFPGADISEITKKAEKIADNVVVI